MTGLCGPRRFLFSEPNPKTVVLFLYWVEMDIDHCLPDCGFFSLDNPKFLDGRRYINTESIGGNGARSIFSKA